MKKLLTLALLALTLLPATAQRGFERYLREGAVPEVDGVVVFTDTLLADGKTRAQIFDALQQYVQNYLMNGENTLPQTRWLEQDVAEGNLAASVEEYIYFKRTKWQTDYARFSYHLIAHIEDARAIVRFQKLRYVYEGESLPNGRDQNFTAERLITDAEAISKKGTLTKIGGKFRRGTIDRIDDILTAMREALGQ